jgi:hypothetical protein
MSLDYGFGGHLYARKSEDEYSRTLGKDKNKHHGKTNPSLENQTKVILKKYERP